MINVTTPAALAAANGPTTPAMPVLPIGANGEILGGSLSPLTVAPVTVTLVDNSVTNATGASQTLLTANTARKALTIVNPSWETTDWTIGPTGATAVAGAVPGIRLSPGDEWTPAKVPLNAITGIGTSTHKLIVLEG